MSKDQALGGLILVICVVLGLFFAATLFYPQWLSSLGAQASDIQFWIIALPVFIAFVAIVAIGGWIGWTMATTPPPKPIEELQTELQKKEPTKEEIVS